MGFGLLFVGYACFFNLYFWGYTDVFAVILQLLALQKLREVSPPFKGAMRAAFPLLAVSFAAFVYSTLHLIGVIGDGDVSTTVYSVLAIAGTVCKLIYTFFLLQAVQKIALVTEVQHIFVRAFRNRLFSCLYYGLWLALELCGGLPLTEEVAKVLHGFTVAVLILGLVVIFLNAKLLFSCYMWICLEGDEDMPRGQSRNPFVNLVNRFTDRIEDRTLARKQAEAEEKARKQAERERLHPHKKRKK